MRRWLFVCALALGMLPSVVQAETLSYDRVYAYAASAFGNGPIAHYVTRIARCESTYNIYATSSGYDRLWRVSYDFRGLMQIDWITHGWWLAKIYGNDPAVLYNPAVNMEAAFLIFKEQGWTAWPYCSRNA